MSEVKHCAIVGGGVIGGGWAARFLLAGHDVSVFDPHPEAERRLREMVGLAERALRKLTPLPLPPQGRLNFAPSLAEAVASADLIQESAPEVESVKQSILAEIDRHARPDALICSSTSGLLPTRISAKMTHPERFLVAHPFNPVYLLPLVELCGGEKTAPETIERARTFFASLGMHPLHVRKEIDGFIADRLLEALWREALWLVNDGVATVSEVDDAIRFGAGLRWAFMGTFQIYRLAGGEAGMRHFMAQFGPTLKLPWTKLMDVPELTEELLDTLDQQSNEQAAGRGFREMEAKRDDCLIGILQTLRKQDFGAGKTLAAFERGMRPGSATASPRRRHEGTVPAEWIDYNGHMNDSRYSQVFSEASDVILTDIGMDAAMLARGFSYYTVESHIIHREEMKQGESFFVTTQILAADDKRLRLFQRLHHAGDNRLLATGEMMLLHVDTNAHRACAADPAVATRVEALTLADRVLEWPPEAGRAIGAPR
jgi:carnitine 3-dehydrogenase